MIKNIYIFRKFIHPDSNNIITKNKKYIPDLEYKGSYLGNNFKSIWEGEIYSASNIFDDKFNRDVLINIDISIMFHFDSTAMLSIIQYAPFRWYDRTSFFYNWSNIIPYKKKYIHNIFNNIVTVKDSLLILPLKKDDFRLDRYYIESYDKNGDLICAKYKIKNDKLFIKTMLPDGPYYFNSNGYSISFDRQNKKIWIVFIQPFYIFYDIWEYYLCF